MIHVRPFPPFLQPKKLRISIRISCRAAFP